MSLIRRAPASVSGRRVFRHIKRITDSLTLYHGTCTVLMVPDPVVELRLSLHLDEAHHYAEQATVTSPGTSMLLYSFRLGDLKALGTLSVDDVEMAYRNAVGDVPEQHAETNDWELGLNWTGNVLYAGPLPGAPVRSRWPNLPPPTPPAHLERAIHGFGKFVARVDYGGHGRPWLWQISSYNHVGLLSGTGVSAALAKRAVLRALPQAPAALRRRELGSLKW